MAKHVVGPLAELPPGSRRLVTVAGRDIALFNVRGELFAVLDRCPHAGASLCKGRLTGLMSADGPGEYLYTREGEIVRCPWHGWEFDLRTGRSCAEPDRLWIRNFDVRVATAEELVAETFPVAVEDSWIVIEA